jgi:hypothetical protein
LSDFEGCCGTCSSFFVTNSEIKRLIYYRALNKKIDQEERNSLDHHTISASAIGPSVAG